MDHESARDLLSEYRDGTLAAGRRDEVAAHLRDCSPCRTELAVYERSAKAFFRTPEISRAETERFARAVMAELEPKPSLLARWLGPAFALSFAAAAVALMPLSPSDPLDELLSGEGDGAVYAWLSQPPASGDVLGLEEQ